MIMGDTFVRDDTFLVVGIRTDLPGVERHEGTDHGAAFDAGVAYWRECQAGQHPGVTEVRMVRTDHWGEAHISGRWVVG